MCQAKAVRMVSATKTDILDTVLTDVCIESIEWVLGVDGKNIQLWKWKRVSRE